MISKLHFGRALMYCATLGAAFLASGCASQPSIGPNTVTGLPGHLDGGAGQVLRFCETLHDKGDLSTAAAMCERAHRLDPSMPEPLLELASILGEMGETQLSVQAYRKVLQTAPNNGPAHYGLGRILLDQDQPDLALAEFKAALEADPRNPRVYSAVGVANGVLGDHAEAQRAFRKGLEVDPEDPALRNNLALSLVQSGRYEEGMSLLSTLTKEPGTVQASRDNLQMAQGLAAAARAEAMMAEEAKARAEREAEAKSEAAAKDQVAGTAEKPAILVSYSSSSWPMDGPGDQGVIPIGPTAKTTIANSNANGEPDRRLSPTRLASSGTPLRAAPKPLTEPTPLTGNMSSPTTPRLEPIRTPAPQQNAAATPAQTSAATSTPMKDANRPIIWQTARADSTDTSDADASPLPGRDPVGWPMANAPDQAATQMPPASASVDYAVQFASYTNEERAWRGWDDLQTAAGELLSGVEPRVERADLGAGKGVVFRLRTAPTAKARAQSLCEAMKARGVECLVVKSEPKMAETGQAGHATSL